jgi:hypothetical protein
MQQVTIISRALQIMQNNTASDQNLGNQEGENPDADNLSSSDLLHYFHSTETDHDDEMSDLTQNLHFSSSDNSPCKKSMGKVDEDSAIRSEMDPGTIPLYDDTDYKVSCMQHDDAISDSLNIDKFASDESLEEGTMELDEHRDNANLMEMDHCSIPKNNEIDSKLASQKPKTSRALKPPPENFRRWVPTHVDVLCGRGSGIYKHPGNNKFRELIESYFPLYEKTCKEEKTSISMMIVEDIKALGGRFLNQDKESGEWYEIERNEARQKAAQALRGYRGLFKKED